MIFNIRKKKELKYRIHTIPKGFLEPHRVMKSLIINQIWDDHFIDVILKENIESINYDSYMEGDIEFLRMLTDFPIRDFILQTPRIKNIEPLSYLQKLECLTLDQQYTEAPDFAKFENLWWVGTDWRPKAKSMLRSKTIRRLGISKHPFVNLEPFSDMPQLELLGLNYGKLKTLEGIEKLPNLTDFSLMYCRSLESLEGIQHAKKLTKERTVVTRCKQITHNSPFAEYVTFDDLV